ncbi:MAG: DUF115 domain-containing protein [Synergistaceae bacterium]|jgi:hypothetical protein|nr:DUF115 domain-containing protein [Synergistaceae bacterium]
MAKEILRAPVDLGIWQENMYKLSASQPRLAKVLADFMARQGHEMAHAENATPAGRWISGLSSEPFFESSAEPKFTWNLKTRETSIFFQYGIGTPPYLFKSIRALPREAMSLVVCEPNIALLAYTLHTSRVYRELPDKASMTFLTFPDENSIFKEQTDELRKKLIWSATADIREEALMAGLNLYGMYSVSSSLVSVHAGEFEAMERAFAVIAKDVREWAVIRVQQVGNSAEDTMIGIRQMSIMAPWIGYGYQYTSLMEKFTGRPFVVVSAGPSLDKNFMLLKDIQDKCVIMATDAVLDKLLRNGITPHIVCCLERGIQTYNAYYAETIINYPDDCSKILLVSQAVSIPQIYGMWPGPKIVVGKAELPIDKWFVVDTYGGQAVTSGSSVAHMCHTISTTLGASSVALIGQDLAYADDGMSHAGGVYSEAVRDAMRVNMARSDLVKVKGAHGGEVLSNSIWLMFLRTLENMIHGAPVPTYDCTEGGALIEGTEIEPFASYISREVSPLSPLEFTPADVMNEAGIVPDRKDWHEMLLVKIKKSRDELDRVDILLDEIRELLKKVAAPGLSTNRRTSHGAKVERLVDEMHAGSQMLSFVTQSYVYLATAEVVKVRFMRDMGEVKRWVKAHQEIIDAHAAVLVFVRRWMDYAKAALDYFADRELPLIPLSPERSFDRLKEIEETLGESSDDGDRITYQIEMDSLLSAVDMPRFGWPGSTLWRSAMFLMKEERSAEAVVLMRAASGAFYGKANNDVPAEVKVAFSKDYARVLAGRDLCHFPSFAEAERVIEIAISLGGIDDEIREIKREILFGDVAIYSNMMESGGVRKTDGVKWIRMRDQASDMMESGDVLGAMKLIWGSIRDYWEFVPELAASHLGWLSLQMEKYFDTDEEPYKAGVDELLSEMASRPDILEKLSVKYSEKFASALAGHGFEGTIATRRSAVPSGSK